MSFSKRRVGAVFCLVFCTLGRCAYADADATVLRQVFHPYADGKPSAEGLAAGTRISQESWQAAQEYLPPEILERVKAGEFSFIVQETTDLPVSDAYIEATKQFASQVRIGADGELEGYVAGLPFPELNPSDPQAGVKAAWNLRHRDFGDIVQVWNTFRVVPESGSADREIENYYVVAYGLHRPRTNGADPNMWAGDGVLYKEFFHIQAPFDLKNSMGLKLRYAQDRYNDDNWSYSPASRKIRKIILKQDEASYDSGFLNEDFFGYWGYVRACQWQLLGTSRLLAPIGAKVATTTFGGRGNWYPVDPWELREMVMLQCTPTASRHLYSKRVLFIDQQTFTPVYIVFYDQAGKHWKTLFELYGNPQHNPGNEHVRSPLWIGESMIDYQEQLGSMTIISKTLYNVPLPSEFFNPDRIMARGQ
ncbi:MAG: DUF1329 domain-containing protein [Deltaproteobacteria bacterium]|nr:DUF1329 domain-containing protein [Deltaproteobacteria bacterium]